MCSGFISIPTLKYYCQVIYLCVVQIWRGWTTQYSHESDLGSMFVILGIDPTNIPLPPDLPSRTLSPIE